MPEFPIISFRKGNPNQLTLQVTRLSAVVLPSASLRLFLEIRLNGSVLVEEIELSIAGSTLLAIIPPSTGPGSFTALLRFQPLNGLKSYISLCRILIHDTGSLLNLSEVSGLNLNIDVNDTLLSVIQNTPFASDLNAYRIAAAASAATATAQAIQAGNSAVASATSAATATAQAIQAGNSANAAAASAATATAQAIQAGNSANAAAASAAAALLKASVNIAVALATPGVSLLVHNLNTANWAAFAYDSAGDIDLTVGISKVVSVSGWNPSNARITVSDPAGFTGHIQFLL